MTHRGIQESWMDVRGEGTDSLHPRPLTELAKKERELVRRRAGQWHSPRSLAKGLLGAVVLAWRRLHYRERPVLP